MNRKEFLKNVLKTGTCACTMLLLSGKNTAFAQSNDSDSKKDNKNQEFIANWTEDLMKIMDQNLDEKTKTKIMEQSGRRCAEKTFKTLALKYKGNVKGLLAFMKEQWLENADFNEEKGVFRLVGKKFKSCFCPMVQGKSFLSTKTFCLCSRGWMKEVFETVTGKKVKVKLEKTILTGADHCEFTVKLV